MGVSAGMWALAGVIVGWLGSFLLAVYTNSYDVIRKKTKAENIQKIELDSIIEIIDEIKKIRLIMSELQFGASAEKAYEEDQCSNVDINFSYNIILGKKDMDNFIFLLKRNITIGGDDAEIEKEIKELENIHENYKRIYHNLIIEKLPETSEPETDGYQWEKVSKLHPLASDFISKEIADKVYNSIDKILKIYKNKLNKNL